MGDGRMVLNCYLAGLLMFASFMSPSEGVPSNVQITNPRDSRKDADLSSTVTLECTGNSGSYYFLSLGWRFMAEDSLTPININNTNSYAVTTTSSSRSVHKTVLQIKRITYWQEGFYYCHIVTDQDEATDYVEVRVKAGAPVIDTRLSTYPGSVNAVLGDALEIVCHVKARPEAQISWYKNGKQLESLPYTISTTIALPTTDARSTLSVFPLTDSQLGDYVCRANNSNGQNQIKWEVVAIPTLSVTQPPTNKTQVMYGYQLLVECEGINFDSTRQIKWFYQNGGDRIELKESTTAYYQIYTFRTASGAVNSELTVDGVDFEHQGRYWCTSGDLTANVWVNVVGQPVVTSSSTTITALSGASVTLNCDIRARPMPTLIGWYSGNTVLTNSSKYEVFTRTADPDSSTELTIHTLDASDYGRKYRCRAQNTLGKDEAAVKIQDVNECNTGANDCDPTQHEVCVDTLGSFECHCKTGYIRVEDVCTVTETTTQAQKPPTPAADQGGDNPVAIGVGVGIGVLILIIVIIVLFLCCRRKNNKGRELVDVPKTEPAAPGRGFYNSAYSVEGEESHIYTELSPTGDEFPRGRLRFLNSLGEGKFGKVVLAEALSISRTGKWEQVAVKMVKETSTDAVKEDFYHELLIVRKIPAHQNVVAYMGCVTASEPALIILEYVNGGDLLSYLRKRRPENANVSNADEDLTVKDLLSFALQTARGLAHIASQKIIHRDVAARNVLIDRKHVCKVSDFGLARDVEGSDIYERTHKGPLPIRWMAPECLRDSVHTTKSDVWAFGVLLWEIVTLGASPYPGMSGQMVMAAVLEGKRLQCPPQCNQEMYNVMSQCWQVSPNARPSFSDMSRGFERMLEEEGDYIQLDHIEEGIYQVLEGARSEERL